MSSKEGRVMGIESCSLCPDNLVDTSKIDFEKIVVFITIITAYIIGLFRTEKVIANMRMM
jgi:hypothetical protein